MLSFYKVQVRKTERIYMEALRKKKSLKEKENKGSQKHSTRIHLYQILVLLLLTE